MNDQFDTYEPPRRSHGDIDHSPSRRQGDYYTRPASKRSLFVTIAILLFVICAAVLVLT